MKLGGMRSYPKQIIVGDQIWDVRFVRKDSEREIPLHILGYCDPSTHTVLIRMGQSPMETLETFLHEVMHCYEFEGDFPISHKVFHKFIHLTEKWWAKFLVENNCEIANILFAKTRNNAVMSAVKIKPRTQVRKKRAVKKGGLS